jgi:TolA-binding protein
MTLPFAVWASASVLSPVRVREVTPVPAAVSETATRGSGAVQARPSREEEPPTATAASSTAWPVASSPQEYERSPARRARAASGERPATSASAPEVSQASVDFAEALKALSRGDFSVSAIKLEGFVRVYPRDPRVEDAAYLLAIALERDARPSEAQAAARRYLAAYPDGAHRAQARRMAGD